MNNYFNLRQIFDQPPLPEEGYISAFSCIIGKIGGFQNFL